VQNSDDKDGLNHAGLSQEAVTRDALAYLEYAALAGVDLLAVRGEIPAAPSEGSLSGCGACPLGERRKDLFEGLGGTRPKVVFVVDVPPLIVKGGVEALGAASRARPSSPFSGARGELLGRIMKAAREKAGLGEADTRLVSAMRCVPPPGTDKDLIEEALTACAPLLLEDLARLGPSVVIALGGVAACAVLGGQAGAPRKGAPLEVRGMTVMPTLGLDELLRDDEKKTLRAAAWKDIQKALRALRG
jgi:uracil-DNA glycosylase family 4